MSIKDLFDPNRISKTVSAKSLEDLASDAESADNVVVERRKAGEFIPPIDFASASNFAVYGSAEKYYSDAVTRIYEEFPYDGSEKEMTEFHLTSSYLDKYIFDEKYPRTNGYIILSAESTALATVKLYPTPTVPEYIVIKGGPNTTLTSTDTLASAFTATPERDQNNVLDIAKGRGNNLAFNAASGSTIEFWMKKTEFPHPVHNEVVFDLWNQAAGTSDEYGRIRIDASPSNCFLVTYRSGTAGGFAHTPIGSATALATLTDDLWHHYAFSFLSSSTSFTADLYIDGELDDTANASAGVMNEVTGTLIAYIGALQTETVLPAISTAAGDAKLSASLDEFRYWKAARTAKDIGRNWFTQVRGGTNTDDANTDLGVYYKFNEGITTSASLDSVVLDYSGRISNGAWTGYNTSARSTESAMVEAGAAAFEYKDPIIYIEHPDVYNLKTSLQTSGSVYDYQNNSSLYHTLPAWIVEGDSSGDLKNLTQIMGSYLDKLQNQVKFLPQLKNTTYLSSSDKPYPFASKLVESAGLSAPEIFVDANILETIMNRDEDRDYALELDDVKNQIYQNIYNNLVHINRSKGTEKSFRNIIHCYGVDDQLVRLNTYANNLTYKLRDNFRSVAVGKRVVDFGKASTYNSTVYQYTASSNTNSVSFISGTAGDGHQDYIGYTLESEIIFPRALKSWQTEQSVSPSFPTSSLFGIHSADTDDSDDTSWALYDHANIQVYAVRPEAGSSDVRFFLTSSVTDIPSLCSPLIKDVYENNKWNFAVRVKNDKYPLGDMITGVSASGQSNEPAGYTIEFYGINADVDVVREEFYLSGSIPYGAATASLNSAKRVYAGAHRTNFTGSVIERSDVKLSSVKYWADYVSNEVIKAHALDTENFGTLNPYRNAFLTQTSLTGTYIPEIDTLALNWNFYNITGSNSSGQFVVDDYSSGSTSLQDRYGWYGNIVKAQHTGRGDFFPTDNTDILDKYYINVARQNIPEVVQTSEMINLLDDNSEYFDRTQRPIDYYLAIEKSMSQAISDEMINLFATITEFNSLIGDPINRYRQGYKLMEKARNIFFEGVDNTPDLDRFIEFYKWIDSSLTVFLMQLIPASANSSDTVRTLVESHILERNKYWSKFPTLEGSGRDIIEGTAGDGGTVGTASPPHTLGLSNPVLSSHPVGDIEAEHAPYWKIRADRTVAPLSTGDPGVDNDKETLRLTLLSGYNRDKNKPVNFSFSSQKTVHGGTNYPDGKDRRLVHNATYPQGPIAASGTPLNVLLVDNVDVDEFSNVKDVIDPNEKKYYSFKTTFRRQDETGIKGVGTETYEAVVKGAIAAPFNLLSSSDTPPGYGTLVENRFKTGSQIVNLHSDTTTADNEIPMQGPFTETHVGGHQSRHIRLNRYESGRTTTNNIDDYTTRPEAWQMLLGSSYGADNAFLGMVGADYPVPVGPYPLISRLKAVRYRGGTAKRPVNIRNIKYTTASVNIGNYERDYEIVQVTGRGALNRYFIDNDGIALPDAANYSIDLQSSAPQTNTLATLLGLKHGAGTFGNFFGVKPSTDDPSILEASNRYEILASFPTIIRTGSASDSVFVSRFSAPGGPEVNTLIYLDLPTAEKAVYNALPFRNLSVVGSGSGEEGTIRVQDQLDKRRGLRTLRALHAGQFGYDATFGSIPAATYITTPSYQKTNRNSINKINFSGVTGYADNSYVTGTIFDNDNVSHAIPRSDLQYSWISSSYSASSIYGHAWNDSVVSSSLEGFHQAIKFVTASHVSAGPHVVDFVGLNTLIYDPIDIENNILSSSANTYINSSIATLSQPNVLNALLLHRNGPYGVNSWKQIRGDSNQIVRYLRNNNVLSYFEKNNYSFPIKGPRPDIKPMRGKVVKYTESPVTSKYKPLTQVVLARKLSPDGNTLEHTVRLDSSYGNLISGFNNTGLNNSYDFRQDTKQAYDRIKNLYLNNQDSNPDSPIQEFDSLIYRERPYPAATNAFSSSIRLRQSYSNSFWRTSRAARIENDASDLLGQSVTSISQSLWMLDADEDFLTRVAQGRINSAGGAGVLQNNYSQIHDGAVTNITASVQYARRHTVDTIGSVVSPAGGVIIKPITSSILVGDQKFNSFSEMGPVSNKPIGLDQYYAGQALWEAGSQSGKQPWYDNYDDYAQHMKLIGKDYSIVPSFRISEHIEEYTKDLNGDFFADNLTFLQMLGGDTDRDKSDEELFYKTYTNSDFLKFFDVMRVDHQEISKPTSITLECKALKKFIPYDGFYPADRMVTMGQQFSSSYGDHVKFTGADSSNSNVALRAFMAPFYAPGIAFNTIKSGIAVDYPMFSASKDTHTQVFKGTSNQFYSGAVISGSNGSGQFHYRIPFEALVEPEKYIADVDMVDLEPHPSCSINVTASWGGRGNDLYKMMSNNFWAEIPDFFLPQEQFATLVSNPESRFLEVKQNEQFAARIKVFKSLNVPQFRTGTLGYRNPTIPRDQSNVYETFTMYSRPTAFGPPCGGGQGSSTIPRLDQTSYDGYNLPFTPPYYNGECWVDLIFTAPRTSTPTTPITLEDIFNPDNLSVSYKRVGNEWSNEFTANTIYHSANVEANSMQMDASFNLFGKAQIKDLRYDPSTGKPIEALDSTENVWVIQPKMETPMLNFSGSEITLPTYGSASAAYGMWHQYGVLPNDPSKGIFMQVTDMPANYIKYALGGDSDSTGSLVDLVGFKTEPVRLGKVANYKTVKEAVVAVPYVYEEGERSFFPIRKEMIDNAKQLVEFGSNADIGMANPPGQSIIDMVRAMRDYVFPPKMDFLENPEAVSPFSMYIFEFEHTFDQQDLTDMWQNLLPKIGYSLDSDNNVPTPPSSEVVATSTIEHDILIDELLSGDLNSKIQWMVFKVKQKANKNYFSKVISQEINQVNKFDRSVGIQVGRDDSGKAFQPKYSYNWPYDFFSLVELVKLDTKVVLGKKENS